VIERAVISRGHVLAVPSWISGPIRTRTAERWTHKNLQQVVDEIEGARISLEGLQKNKLNGWNNFETTISARSYSSRLETSYVVVTESVPFPMV